MLIPLGGNQKYQEYVYTCKNLGADGNCQIYADRPQLCRDFPDQEGCKFWKCTAKESVYLNMSFLRKLWTKLIGSSPT